MTRSITIQTLVRITAGTIPAALTSRMPTEGAVKALQVSSHLQPAPLEPTRVLGEAAIRRGGVPLVHTAGIEEQSAFDRLGPSAVGVAVNDHVGVWEPSLQRPRQAVDAGGNIRGSTSTAAYSALQASDF